MKQYSQQSIHNVALLGHGGSGKTTLADAVLCYGKATERIGKIADSTTVMDFDPEEKKRKTSVSTSVYALELGGHKLNIIDAPGLFDFAGGVSEALAAADSAVIAVSGKSGLTTGAKQSFQKARALKKAVAFFVGKLDSSHAHFYRVISSLVANYGAVICPVVIPYIENDEVKSYIDLITNKAYACDGLELKELRMPVSNEADEMRSMLLEAIATADDALMEKYFAGEEFTPEEIIEGLKKGVTAGEICPVFAGVQQTGAAVPLMVDTLLQILPSAADAVCLVIGKMAVLRDFFVVNGKVAGNPVNRFRSGFARQRHRGFRNDVAYTVTDENFNGNTGIRFFCICHIHQGTGNAVGEFIGMARVHFFKHKLSFPCSEQSFHQVILRIFSGIICCTVFFDDLKNLIPQAHCLIDADIDKRRGDRLSRGWMLG